METLRYAIATLLCLATLPVFAASRIVPPEPTAFEPVVLRMTVDSCSFVPGSVSVESRAQTLGVRHSLVPCLVAGPPEVVDVRLGSLPVGTYRVEVYPAPNAATPSETLAFTVSARPEIAVFPPPPKPLADHSGLWWTASEGGWGLSLHQSPGDALFGAWFVYGAAGQPEWFTLQGGQWTSATRWTGTIYRNTGPFFAGSAYDPRLVLVQAAGTAVLDFRQVPGTEGEARFTYTVNGATSTKTITRFRF